MSKVLAVISFIDQFGRPIDPGFGNRPGGGEYPDQGLPGGGESPDQGLPGGRPGHPSQGLPIGGGGWHPTDPGFGNRPPRPKPWPPQRPSWPPDPTDPEWGVDVGGAPSHPIYLPIGPSQGLPGEPAGPDQGLPPVAGHLPSPNPPPGTIWPPLPPGLPPGKCAILVWISGVGHRYAVIDVPATPDQGLPSGGKPQPK